MLTRVLQKHYCHKQRFFWVSAGNDNPDQRITQDTSMFCNNLGSITRVIAAAPFQVALPLHTITKTIQCKLKQQQYMNGS